MTECPFCGESLPEVNDAFCTFCGERIDVERETFGRASVDGELAQDEMAGGSFTRLNQQPENCPECSSPIGDENVVLLSNPWKIFFQMSGTGLVLFLAYIVTIFIFGFFIGTLGFLVFFAISWQNHRFKRTFEATCPECNWSETFGIRIGERKSGDRVENPTWGFPLKMFAFKCALLSTLALLLMFVVPEYVDQANEFEIDLGYFSHLTISWCERFLNYGYLLIPICLIYLIVEVPMTYLVGKIGSKTQIGFASITTIFLLIFLALTILTMVEISKGVA